MTSQPVSPADWLAYFAALDAELMAAALGAVFRAFPCAAIIESEHS